MSEHVEVLRRLRTWMQATGVGEWVAALDAAIAALSAPAEAQPVAWATHHETPMLFPSQDEASSYCDQGEHPVPLYAHPPPSAPVGVECVRCGNRPEGGETTKLSLLGLVEYARTAVNPSQGATRWHLIDLLEQALPHLEALTQQPAAVGETARRDAARYRFLRDNNGVRNHHGVEVYIDGEAHAPGRLDAQVDAALASQQGGRVDG